VVLSASLVSLLLVGGALRASAGTCAWTGNGADANWTTALNWSPAAAPQSGDHLLFSGSVQLNPNNDLLANTPFGGLTFDALAGGFTLGGNAINFSGLVQNASANPQTITLPVELIDLTTLDTAPGDTVFSGAVITDTNFSKTGPGRLDLFWDWFHSPTAPVPTLTVYGGVAAINDGGNSSTPGAQVNYNPHITMSGGSLILDFASYWCGAVVPFTTNSTVGIGAGRLDFSGTMGSPGYTWTKTGPGTLNTSYWATNLTVVQASAIIVAEGTLSDLPNNAAWDTNQIAQWGGPSVPITVAAGAALEKGDCGVVLNPIELQGGDGTGNGDGALYAARINNSTTLSPTISFLNTITLDSDSSIGSWYGTLVLAGPITGPGGLTKVGANPLVLSGTNIYAGNTTVNAGTLQVGSPLALPNGAGRGNVQLNTSSTLDLNGFNASVNGLLDNGDGSAVLDNSSPSTPTTLTLGGNDQGVSFTGHIKSTGAALGVAKVGTGTASLLGANTYKGANIVLGGKLEINVPTGTATNDLVSLADGTELSLHKTVAAAALKPPSLTLGSSGATILDIDLGGFGNPLSALFSVTNGTGTLTVGGNCTINIAGNGSVMAVGQFSLIKYLARAGSGTFTLGTLPNQIAGILVTNAVNKSIDLKITSAPITKWVGNINGDWDINTTANWSLLGVPSKYQDGVGVLFDDTAMNTTVNITTGVSPGGTLINAATNYTFSGAGNINSGDLTKSGTGTLALLNANNYNNTIISAGTLQVDNGGTSGTLGLANVQNDATLIFDRGDAISVAGSIAGVGTIVQQGTNTLTLSGANTYSGGTLLNHGVVQLGQGMNQPAGSLALGTPAGTTPLATVSPGAALDMNDTRIATANNPVVISGTGTGTTPGVGSVYTSGSGYQWFGSGTPPCITNVQLAADASIGGNNGWFEIGSHSGTVTGGGGIDGKGHVLTKTGSSTIVLKQNALSALSQAVVTGGRYILTCPNPFGNSAAVILDGGAMDTWGEGVAGWAGVTVPNNFQVTANGGAVRNTQGAWYNHANFDTYTGAFALTGILTLQNSSTYYGNGNGGYAYIRTYGQMNFTGPMSGTGGVTKTGPYSVSLLGANTYTGPTLVTAGTLSTTTSSQGGGAYTSDDGATLDIAVNSAFPAIPMSSLTLGSITGAVFSLQNNIKLTASAPVIATNLTLTGTSSFLPPGWAYANPGTYPIIKYTGAVSGGGSLIVGGPGARGIAASIQNNTANSTMDLVMPVSGNAVTWVGNLGGTWDIGATANWTYLGSPTTYQQNATPGDAVLFDDTAATTLVNIATPVTPSVVSVNNSSKNFTFIGTNITGPATLVKSGSGSLTLSNGNYYLSGGTFINAGKIILGNDAGLNNFGGVVTIVDGATLDLNNFNPSGTTVNASGAGLGGLGAIVDNYSPSAGNTRGPGTINMLGNLTVGGTNRWSLRNGARTLNCPTNGYSLIKVGPNMVDFAGATVSPNLGDIIILGGTFSHRNANSSLGNVARLIKIGAGATLNFNGNPPVSLKPVIATNTATIQTDSSGMTIGNPITLDSGTVYIDANYNNTVTYTNVISGAGGIRFNWNSQVTFTAPNTYTGDTEVRQGPYGGPASYLKLSGTGSIANSANIHLDGNGLGTNYLCGSILDVTTRTDGKLTLSGGQNLRGDNGSAVKGNVIASAGSTIWPGGPGYIQTMTFSNAVTFQGGSTCAMDVNKDTATNDLMLVTGALTYGGTLQINHLGTTAYAAGDSFKLFTAGSYAGNFAAITPATPAQGLLWDTSALASTGTLKIMIQPVILPPYLDGSGHLVLSVNTMTGKNFILQSAPSLTPPVVWTPVNTNAGTGSILINAVPLVPGENQKFFRYLMQ
jgi:autotransporter-associated beta strand protein